MPSLACRFLGLLLPLRRRSSGDFAKFVVAAACLALGTGPAVADAADAQPRKPNIVLILADDK